jgi:SRSO17 transposase
LDALRRLTDAGVHFDTVLADPEYGACAESRDELTRLVLTWAVGIVGTQRARQAALRGFRVTR